MSAQPIDQSIFSEADNRLYLLPPGALARLEPPVGFWARMRANDSFQLLVLELKALAVLGLFGLVIFFGENAWAMLAHVDWLGFATGGLK